MSDEEAELANAKRSATQARERLRGTLTDLRARLKPKALAREAAEDLKGAGRKIARGSLDTAGRYPIAIAGIAAVIGLFAARRPLRRLFTRKETPAGSRRLPDKTTRGTRS